MILKPFKENQCSDKYFANIEKKLSSLYMNKFSIL